MWIEKTRYELNTAEKKSRLRRGFMALLCWAGLAYLSASAGFWHNLDLGFITLPVKSVVPGAVLPWLIAAALIGALFWLRQTNPSNKPQTVVCPLCNRVKTNDGIQRCDCGGVFRGIGEMKWVEGRGEKLDDTTGPNPRSVASTVPASL